MKKNKGFTLIELMIVIAIIGILAAVGYPSYLSHVKKANRADGIDSLMALAGRMEAFYLINDTYAGATVKGNGTGTVGSNKSSDGLYRLNIANPQPDAFYYRLRARPLKGDPECGNLFIDSTGKKTESGPAKVADCW